MVNPRHSLSLVGESPAMVLNALNTAECGEIPSLFPVIRNTTYISHVICDNNDIFVIYFVILSPCQTNKLKTQ